MSATQEHILLVDDDPGITEHLSRLLEKEGFRVTPAAEGEMALELARALRPDLVLLDIDLPNMNGWSVLRRMRKDEDQIPVIILTKYSEQAYEIEGFDLGADDYIGKPFSSEVVILRIRSVLRRTRAGKPSLARSPRLKCRQLILDRRTRRAQYQKRELKLRPKEFALLECLMLHPDEVLSRNRMLDDLGWDDPRLIDRHMADLRKALGDDPRSPVFIETVHTEGYRFIKPVEALE